MDHKDSLLHQFPLAEDFFTFVASCFLLVVIFLAGAGFGRDSASGMIISSGCGASKFNLLHLKVV